MAKKIFKFFFGGQAKTQFENVLIFQQLRCLTLSLCFMVVQNVPKRFSLFPKKNFPDSLILTRRASQSSFSSKFDLPQARDKFKCRWLNLKGISSDNFSSPKTVSFQLGFSYFVQ